ncbi:MAG: hypothetical protein ACRDPT_03200 [Streptomycetales bacterium]
MNGVAVFPQPRKFLRYVVLAVAVLFVVRAPEEAAHMVVEGFGVAGQAMDAFDRFVGAL